MPIDFTSSLYLGFRHDRDSLRGWHDFSSGKPATFGQTVRADRLEGLLARLSGCRQALLGRSTLHLFHDLFGILGRQPVTFFVDESAYPIAGWSLSGLCAHGGRVISFRHLDADSLKQKMNHRLRAATVPVVVSDGYCPLCGRHAPLSRYAETVRDTGGLLVVDDTQALGIFGRGESVGPLYGRGGGGSLQFCRVPYPRVVTVTSLAKGFGVPVAFLAGPTRLVQSVREQGESRMHCSPPSNADLSALQHALTLNAATGDTVRYRLIQRVAYLHGGLRRIGLRPVNGLFPMQFVILPEGVAVQLSRSLVSRGIRTLNQRPCVGGGLTLTMIVTARHCRQQIDELLGRLACLLYTVHRQSA